jgi:ATP-binding cassette, subfamily B, multidrug efflux pump
MGTRPRALPAESAHATCPRMFRLFERRVDAFPESRPGAPPRALLRFAWHYVKDASPWLGVITGLGALIAIGEVMLFGFMGQLVDMLAGANREMFWADHGASLVGMGALVLVGLPLAVAINSFVLYQALMSNVPMSARWRMHRHLIGQSMTFFANEFAGRIATKLMQTALSVREVVIKTMDVMVFVTVYFLAMLATLALADWRLVLPLALWLAAYVGLLTWFIPRLGRISEAQADARSTMTGRIVDSYTNIATVKLFAHSGREEAYARESMEEFIDTAYRQMRLVTQFQSLTYFNNAIVVFLISAMSVWLWQAGAISVGAIAVGVALALRLNGMSQWIMWEVSALFENIGVVHDGAEMLTKPQTVVDRPGAPPLKTTGGGITFDGVRFHYGKEGGLIEDLRLVIQPGEKVGLVGRSGAGKSTLVNLLLRFHDVEGGCIRIDGQDISAVTQDSLRAHIGMVTQETSLLHRSIRENIAYGKPDATDADIREAARRANALPFIESLVDQKGRSGFDSHVGERGVKLSGGQRQRIAIARIFLKDAPILVLDEATSALDSEVEAAIQEHLFDLMAGKTVISIAHRLSTIAAMDRLIVIDQGRIVEEGTHAQLLARGGLYADLWARQSGGFLTPRRPAPPPHETAAEEMDA